MLPIYAATTYSLDSPSMSKGKASKQHWGAINGDPESSDYIVVGAGTAGRVDRFRLASSAHSGRRAGFRAVHERFRHMLCGARRCSAQIEVRDITGPSATAWLPWAVAPTHLPLFNRQLYIVRSRPRLNSQN